MVATESSAYPYMVVLRQNKTHDVQHQIERYDAQRIGVHGKIETGKNPYLMLVGGFNPSEKYEFVSWDLFLPNIWNVIKFHGSHHQPALFHPYESWENLSFPVNKNICEKHP